jgi:hypothetical protein
MPDEPKGLTSMPSSSWWALRERFRRALPSKVDATYVASALGMAERSAETNILPALRSTGLIDAGGKPTDRAVKWRDDAHYKDVCEAIRSEIYPKALLDLAPPESAERAEVERWFANTARVGEAQKRKLAAFYLLLCASDPAGTSGAKEGDRGGGVPPTRPAPARKATARKSAGPRAADADKADASPADEGNRPGLSLHLDVQVHISPDTTAEQIDLIFASIGKHLKGL